MIRTWIAVGAVALVGIFAAADALRDGGEEPAVEPPAAKTEKKEEGGRRLAGPALPVPGALPGTLWLETADGCRIQRLDITTMRLAEEGSKTGCGLWVSPGGRLAVVPAVPAGDSSTRKIWLVSLGGRPSFVRPIGRARGEIAWSADGQRVAWCDENGRSAVLSVGRGSLRAVRGCRPVFGPDGSLLTREERVFSAELLRDGRPALRERDLRRGFSAGVGRLDLLGFDESPAGVLAVAVRRLDVPEARALIELWQGDELEVTFELPLFGGTGSLQFGQLVRFSPDGGELAVGFPDPGTRVGVYDAHSGRELLPPTTQQGFAWSRDGTWLALSTGEEILVYGPERAAPVYVLPIAAAVLAWR